MQDTEKCGIGRREFIGTAAAALFAGIAIQLTGCSSDESTGPKAEAGDKVGTVADNHSSPHVAVIKKAQLDATGAITLDIAGSAGHSHKVEITADNMVAIKAGTHTMLQSSTTNSHSHSIHFN